MLVSANREGSLIHFKKGNGVLCGASLKKFEEVVFDDLYEVDMHRLCPRCFEEACLIFSDPNNETPHYNYNFGLGIIYFRLIKAMKTGTGLTIKNGEVVHVLKGMQDLVTFDYLDNLVKACDSLNTQSESES